MPARLYYCTHVYCCQTNTHAHNLGHALEHHLARHGALPREESVTVKGRRRLFLLVGGHIAIDSHRVLGVKRIKRAWQLPKVGEVF
jgi:hypothetical protein